MRKKYPFQVLWRWEEEEMPDLPPNVMLGRWFPQQDLLGIIIIIIIISSMIRQRR